MVEEVIALGRPRLAANRGLGGLGCTGPEAGDYVVTVLSEPRAHVVIVSPGPQAYIVTL